MVGQILKQWMWDCYDHLGRLLVANMIAFIVLLFLGIYGFRLAEMSITGNNTAQAMMVLFLSIVIVIPIILAIWFAIFGKFGDLVSKEKDPAFREFLGGLRRDFLRCWRYFLFGAVVTATLLLNIWFYTRSLGFPESLRVLGFVLAGLCFWVGMVFLISMTVGIPFYIRERLSMMRAVRMGFVLFLKFPGAVFGVMFMLAGLWVIGTWPLKLGGVLLFGLAGTSMMLNSLYDVAMEMESAREKAREENKEPPRNWRELQAREKLEEKERIAKSRYERTFRDLLRPWEM